MNLPLDALPIYLPQPKEIPTVTMGAEEYRIFKAAREAAAARGDRLTPGQWVRSNRQG